MAPGAQSREERRITKRGRMDLRLQETAEGEHFGAENDLESYPHSTQWTRNYLKRRIWNSTGSAMAYVHFPQILYSAKRTSGP
jgi:hypothetical protein